jgi:hypothetical protein
MVGVQEGTASQPSICIINDNGFANLYCEGSFLGCSFVRLIIEKKKPPPDNWNELDE